MRFTLFILTAFVMIMSFMVTPSISAQVQAIVATVNDDVISMRDLGRRVSLVIASSGLPNTEQIQQKVAPQVLNNLINEKIMLQEAQKLGLSVDEKEIEQGFDHIASQNKMTGVEFAKMLTRGGLDVATMHEQVKAQLAWTKVVQKKLQPQIVISDRDIEDARERILSKVGSNEYLAAEIYLPTDSTRSEKETRQLANQFVKEIKSGKVSFFKLAQQFSKAAGSTKGGDTGWLHEDQISDEVLSALKSTQKGKVTKPIKTIAGYHIFFLRDKRTLSEDNVPSNDQILFEIGNRRLEKMQARHMIDLRASTFVDVRL